ncbi:MAG: O-antigen ligase family protein [Aquisalimonadaceae bacterium]
MIAIRALDSESQDEPLHPAAFGVLLYLMVSVGRLPELLPVLAPLHLGKLALVFGLLGLLIGWSRSRVPVFSTLPGRLLLALSGLAVLSVVFSIWTMHSLAFVMSQLLAGVLLFLLLARTTSGPRMLVFHARGLVISGLLLALMMIRAGGAERVTILSSYDPNDLAMVLVFILPLAVVGFFAARGFRRYAFGVVTAAMLVAILLTSSRGGFLALLAVGVYLLLARLPRADGGFTSRISPGKAFIALLAAALLVVATPQTAWDRIATVFSPGDDYNLTDETGRIAIWKRGLAAMAERPWGYGVKAFEAVEGERGGRHQAAHNSFIQVGVELGVPGLLLYLALLRVCWTRLGALRVRGLAADSPDPVTRLLFMLATALRGSLIGFVVAGFFLSAAYSAILFVLIALTVAAENVAGLVTAQAVDSPAAPAGRTLTPAGEAVGDRRRADTGFGY